MPPTTKIFFAAAMCLYNNANLFLRLFAFLPKKQHRNNNYPPIFFLAAHFFSVKEIRRAKKPRLFPLIGGLQIAERKRR